MSKRIPIDPYKIMGIQRGASKEEIILSYKSLMKRYLPTKKNEGNQKICDLIKKVTTKLLQDIQEREKFVEEYERHKKENKDNDMVYDVDDSQYSERNMTSYLRERDDLGERQNIMQSMAHGVPDNFNSIFEQIRTQQGDDDDDDDQFNPVPTELEPQLTFTEYEFDENGERRIKGSKHGTNLEHSELNGDMTYDLSKCKVDPHKRENTNYNKKITRRHINDKIRERDIGITIDKNAGPTQMEFAHDTSMENIRNLRIRKFDDISYDTSEKVDEGFDISGQRMDDLTKIDSEIIDEYTHRLEEQRDFTVPPHVRSYKDGFMEGFEVDEYAHVPLTLNDIQQSPSQQTQSQQFPSQKTPMNTAQYTLRKPQKNLQQQKYELDNIRNKITIMEKNVYELKRLYNHRLKIYQSMLPRK